MKLRQGIVSNSSSSSFIVLFDKLKLAMNGLENTLYPATDAVRGVMDPYGESEWNKNPYNYTAEDVASRVQNQWENNIKEVNTKLREEVVDAIGTVGFNLWYYHQNEPWPDYSITEQLKTGELKDTELGELLKITGYKLTDRDDENLEELGLLAKLDHESRWPPSSAPQEEQDTYRDAQQRRWNRVEELTSLITDNIMKHIKKMKDVVVQVIVFSDESGEGTLEHGDTFRNVPYVRISHH